MNANPARHDFEPAMGQAEAIDGEPHCARGRLRTLAIEQVQKANSG